MDSGTVSKIIEYLVLLGFGGVIVEVVRSFFQKKKMGADYADVISASAVRLLEPLERRIKDLEHQLERCQMDLAEAQRETRLLREEASQERREIRDQQERREIRETPDGHHV